MIIYKVKLVNVGHASCQACLLVALQKRGSNHNL